jgi:hypothetical protein
MRSRTANLHKSIPLHDEISQSIMLCEASNSLDEFLKCSKEINYEVRFFYLSNHLIMCIGTSSGVKPSKDPSFLLCFYAWLVSPWGRTIFPQSFFHSSILRIHQNCVIKYACSCLFQFKELLTAKNFFFGRVEIWDRSRMSVFIRNFLKSSEAQR